MSPWLWMLVGVALSGAVTWCLLWTLREKMFLRDKRMLERLDALQDDHAEIDAGLHDVHRALKALSEQPKPEEPWTGAFLPTDEGAAAMERQILSSEDRAISATGVSVPSRRPSRRSVGRSPRAVLTRPANSSGSAS
jgi:hypothetical protein